MAQITISTHNGSTVALGHNRRIEAIIKRENEKWKEKYGEDRIHLDKPNGHEIWHDEDIKDVYEKIFKDSIEEFNQRQIANSHPERVINDYLQKIRAEERQKKAAKHPCYEMILSVGSKNNPVDEAVAKEILKQAYEKFKEKFPQFYVVGCYFHNDEANPHLHIDYIPVAQNCNRGPSVQNGLKQSLKEMGIEGDSKKNTAQMKFERIMNDELEQICNAYGYKVIHPQRGSKVEHLTNEELKLMESIAEKRAELDELSRLPLNKVLINKGRLSELEQIEAAYKGEKVLIDKAKKDMQSAKNTFEAYDSAYKRLQNDKAEFDKKVNEAANQKMKLARNVESKFIVASGLADAYMTFVEQTQKEAEKESQKM